MWAVATALWRIVMLPLRLAAHGDALWPCADVLLGLFLTIVAQRQTH